MKENDTIINDKKEKIVADGKLCDAVDYDHDAITTKSYVYDVIRVIDGRPLFAKEHFLRLCSSIRGVGGEPDFDLPEMCRNIEALVEANQVRNDNVEIIIDRDEKSAGNIAYYYLKHATYPGAEDYAHGVDTELFNAVRENPHIKLKNHQLRDATDKVIAEKGLFEVILVDGQGCITEGSRSNIFLIKDGIVYTCYEEGVLLGVTRQKIFQICEENGIEIIQRAIPAASLEDYDAGFISGTSPKVLPIRRIGEVQLDVNDATLRRIMELYDTEIERS